MPSQLKSETARANGAKSRGPVTPEGRAKSSQNSVRHGLTATSIVLPTESQEDFQILLDGYVEQFHPHGDVQMEMVEVMVAARWRLRRICTIETSLLNNELVRREDEMDREFNNISGDDRLAWVFQKLANHQQCLALLVRYEGALNRSYDRAFKHLMILQRPSPGAGPEQGPEQCPAPASPTNSPRVQPERTEPAPNPESAPDPNPGRPCPSLGSFRPGQPDAPGHSPVEAHARPGRRFQTLCSTQGSHPRSDRALATADTLAMATLNTQRLDITNDCEYNLTDRFKGGWDALP